MTGNKTFTMIKPTAVAQGSVGKILDRILEEGYLILALKMVHLCQREAEAFYEVHKERPFFGSLTEYMSSGPIVAAILQKDNAVDDYRTLIGATNPGDAAEGTIRKLYGTDLGRNAVHGSDSRENAEIECSFFFSGMEEMSW
ncbi:MAG: nucleoside-diphosphate kinase [Bacteroidales bacterium]|nr:nucleoside-diphosphate kinase [Bacteroidales bacterium]